LFRSPPPTRQPPCDQEPPQTRSPIKPPAISNHHFPVKPPPITPSPAHATSFFSPHLNHDLNRPVDSLLRILKAFVHFFQRKPVRDQLLHIDPARRNQFDRRRIRVDVPEDPDKIQFL